MAGAIGPGTLLLCVRADPIDDGLALNPLDVGAIYECSSSGPSIDICPHCGTTTLVSLAGLPSTDAGYWTCQFVPAGRRGDFAANLNVEPIREDA